MTTPDMTPAEVWEMAREALEVASHVPGHAGVGCLRALAAMERVEATDLAIYRDLYDTPALLLTMKDTGDYDG